MGSHKVKKHNKMSVTIKVPEISKQSRFHLYGQAMGMEEDYINKIGGATKNDKSRKKIGWRRGIFIRRT